MRKNTLIFFSLLVITILVGGWFYQNSKTKQTRSNLLENGSMMDKNEDTMIKEDKTGSEIMLNDFNPQSGYVSYAPDYLNRYKNKRKVLFFHANWCPTCKAANQNINDNLDKIPDDVVIIKTDYDKEVDLKKKYGISYQHSFVLVDDNGDQLDIWNGGDLEEILRRI